MHIDGRCHCGKITYTADVDPSMVSICHCTDCQAFSGAPFRASVPATAAAFRLTGAQPKIYVKTAESGKRRAQGFCGDCGSPIYAADAEDAKLYHLRLGSIAQRAELTPRRQIWTKSAMPWASDVRALPAAERTWKE